MYQNPSMHFELSKQRQQDLIAEARRVNVPKHLESDIDSERMLAVKGVFAGIAAAVGSLVRTKPVSQPAAENPC